MREGSGIRSVVLLWALSGLSPLWAQGMDRVEIIGKLRNADGTALEQKVLVTLESSSGSPAEEKFTDHNGNFRLGNVSDGYYYVVTKSPDHENVREMVRIHFRQNRTVHVTLFLNPKKRQQSEALPGIKGDRSSWTVALGDLSQSFAPRVLDEYHKGTRAAAKGNREKAIGHYRQALQMAPDFYPASNNLGLQYERSGNLEQAERAYRQACDARPQVAQPYLNLGRVCYERQAYERSVEALVQALQLDPGSPAGHLLLGSAFYKLGQFLLGTRHLETALELDPQQNQARLQLANIYLKLGERQKALEQLQAYVAANPQDPRSSDIRTMIGRLGGVP
ncbi:MAG: tetratricopeptide repeat protein [Acidobacteria bacterium]|nr:tetratricopeptide repeat protein [Acidobacteriota bacterium]